MPTRGWLQRQRLVFAPGCSQVRAGTRALERNSATTPMKLSLAPWGKMREAG